jgi:radical SAM superfamily enzyme YgiQ (UPF0313 family)
MDAAIFTPGHPSSKKKSLPPALTAPYLAALASPYFDRIKIYDLAVEPFNPSSHVPDVAMFTTTMAQCESIFEIASKLKSKGSKIFFGGPYATLAYDFDPRIQATADCVVFGEGEKALPEALKDYRNGDLKSVYSHPITSLEGIPFSRLDLLNRSKYYSSTAVFGTRGCRHRCSYCSIRSIYGQKYLKRPVDEVIEEIKFQTSDSRLPWSSRKIIQFWDDNPACDLDWFHDLLRKMIPLKKWWLSQMCLNVADNKETVKLMQASGCKGIFVGLETISEEILVAQNKETVNKVSEYKRQSRILLEHGINIVGAIMFGFDQDSKESLFKKTPGMLQEMGLTLLQPLMVTPYPHLDYYNTLLRENRIITQEPKFYNGYTVVHKPIHMHPAELQEGFVNFRREFYSWRSVLKRMLKHRLHKFPEFLVWNFLYHSPNYQIVPEVDVAEWTNHLKNLQV